MGEEHQTEEGSEGPLQQQQAQQAQPDLPLDLSSLDLDLSPETLEWISRIPPPNQDAGASAGAGAVDQQLPQPAPPQFVMEEPTQQAKLAGGLTKRPLSPPPQNSDGDITGTTDDTEQSGMKRPRLDRAENAGCQATPFDLDVAMPQASLQLRQGSEQQVSQAGENVAMDAETATLPLCFVCKQTFEPMRSSQTIRSNQVLCGNGSSHSSSGCLKRVGKNGPLGRLILPHLNTNPLPDCLGLHNIVFTEPKTEEWLNLKRGKRQEQEARLCAAVQYLFWRAKKKVGDLQPLECQIHTRQPIAALQLGKTPIVQQQSRSLVAAPLSEVLTDTTHQTFADAGVALQSSFQELPTNAGPDANLSAQCVGPTSTSTPSEAQELEPRAFGKPSQFEALRRLLGEIESANGMDSVKATVIKAHDVVNTIEKQHDARLLEMGMNNTDRYNIAICGLTGEGKSTMVNGFLGESAVLPVEEGVECTQNTQSYMLGEQKSVVLWDLPGGFTERCPAETYCFSNCLDLVDCLVMCYHDRWGKLNDTIVRFAHEHGRRLIVAYTKVDHSVSHLVRSKRCSTVSEAFNKLKQMVQVDIAARFTALELPVPEVLFVDSLAMQERTSPFDELRLIETLVQITTKHKKSAFTPEQEWENVMSQFNFTGSSSSVECSSPSQLQDEKQRGRSVTETSAIPLSPSSHEGGPTRDGTRGVFDQLLRRTAMSCCVIC